MLWLIIKKENKDKDKSMQDSCELKKKKKRSIKGDYEEDLSKSMINLNMLIKLLPYFKNKKN